MKQKSCADVLKGVTQL